MGTPATSSAATNTSTHVTFTSPRLGHASTGFHRTLTTGAIGRTNQFCEATGLPIGPLVTTSGRTEPTPASAAESSTAGGEQAAAIQLPSATRTLSIVSGSSLMMPLIPADQRSRATDGSFTVQT